MARLVPTLTLFFCLSILLSSSRARSPTTSPENDVIDLQLQQDVSELKSNIVLPTDKVLDSDSASAVSVDADVEENRPGSGKFSGEMVNWRPMSRYLDRKPCKCPLHCRHRGPRFDGGAQIRPRRTPIWKEGNEVDEDNEHHHHDHHGEIFSTRWIDGPRSHQLDAARFSDVDGEQMMIGEFKHPRFFFHRHHHHHDHHHHHHDEDEEIEEREHHRYGKGHGFWKPIRKFLNHF